MRHRNPVDILLLPFEQRRYISVHLDLGGDHQHRDQHSRQQNPHRRQRSLNVLDPPQAFYFFARQSNSQQHRDRRPSAETVILHPRTERQREKQKNESAPQRKQKLHLLWRPQIFPTPYGRKPFERRHQKNTPRE